MQAEKWEKLMESGHWDEQIQVEGDKTEKTETNKVSKEHCQEQGLWLAGKQKEETKLWVQSTVSTQWGRLYETHVFLENI